MIKQYKNLNQIPKNVIKELNTLGLDSGYMKFYWRCFKQIKDHDKNDFIFDIFVMEVNKKIIGSAYCQNLLYRYKDYVELDIYIKPKHRKKGYASKILNAIDKKTKYKKSLFAQNGLYKHFDKNKSNFYLFDLDYNYIGNKKL